MLIIVSAVVFLCSLLILYVGCDDMEAEYYIEKLMSLGLEPIMARAIYFSFALKNNIFGLDDYIASFSDNYFDDYSYEEQ